MVVKSFAVKTGSDAGGPICLAPAACETLSAKLLTAAVLQLHALRCLAPNATDSETHSETHSETRSDTHHETL